ncbi:MAG: hypothetical protein VX099_01380, partial [Pseudomonadota bacterium]|nr:hypothetical protein [Pseudomonadota bacterium]
ARVGTCQSVLIEKPGEGRTPCFARVQFQAMGEAPKSGDIVPIRITGHDGERLLGETDLGDSA